MTQVSLQNQAYTSLAKEAQDAILDAILTVMRLQTERREFIYARQAQIDAMQEIRDKLCSVECFVDVPLTEVEVLKQEAIRIAKLSIKDTLKELVIK